MNRAITLSMLAIVLVISVGCRDLSRGGKVSLVLHEKPFLTFNNVRSVRIIDSNLVFKVSKADWQFMGLLAPNFDAPVTVDINFGDQLYTKAHLDFSLFDFNDLDSREMVIPEIPWLEHVIEEAGITVSR